MRIILIAILLSVMSSQAKSTLLDFEDVNGVYQNGVADVINYKGFDFSINMDWIDLDGSHWNFGAVSGEFGLLNNNGGTGIITEENGNDFSFDGLWAKRWATQPESGGTDSLFGTLQGFNDGSLIWSVNTSLNGSYEFYAAQAGAIDELRLGFGNHFLVDDITLNGSVAVPEPSTLAIFALSILGFAMTRRKKFAQ